MVSTTGRLDLGLLIIIIHEHHLVCRLIIILSSSTLVMKLNPTYLNFNQFALLSILPLVFLFVTCHKSIGLLTCSYTFYHNSNSISANILLRRFLSVLDIQTSETTLFPSCQTLLHVVRTYHLFPLLNLRTLMKLFK